MAGQPPRHFVGTIRDDIERVLVSRHEIDDRLQAIGGQIARLYQGQELTIVAVLTGALMLLADLIRHVPLHMRVDLVSVSSYPGQSTASQGPQVHLPIPADLGGRHVLVLDDILDSGATLKLLLEEAARMNPASLRSCVLVRKYRPDLADRIEADFVGFDVPNEFVIGYGMDFDNLYRNLPDICVLKAHAAGGGERP